MRAIRCAVAALLVAGIVAVVGAQPGGGRFGGGGGGDLTSLVLTNVALQEDLKITAEQKEKFKPVGEKLTALNKKRAEMFGGGGKGKFDKDKATELQDEGKKVAEEVKKVADETLTDAQKKRFADVFDDQLSGRVEIYKTAAGSSGKLGAGGMRLSSL